MDVQCKLLGYCVISMIYETLNKCWTGAANEQLFPIMSSSNAAKKREKNSYTEIKSLTLIRAESLNNSHMVAEQIGGV